MINKDFEMDYNSKKSMTSTSKPRRAMSTNIIGSLIIIAAVVLCCLQSYSIIGKYLAYSVRTETDTALGTSEPFPAISVCNMRSLDVYTLNEIHRKFEESPQPNKHVNSSDPFIREYMKYIAKASALQDEYGTNNPEVFDEIFSRSSIAANIDPDIISDAAISLDEYIASCNLAGMKCDRSADFSKVFDPNYYNCFTFTAPEMSERTPRGMAEGLSTTLFTGNGILNTNEKPSIAPGIHASSEGVRVVIHPHGTKPIPLVEGFDVPPGYSALVGVRPRVNELLPAPYGMCQEESEHRHLACQRQCTQEQIISKCNCADVTLPVTQETRDVKFCRSSSNIPDDCTSDPTQNKCLDTLTDISKNMQCLKSVHKTARTQDSCYCSPPCQEVLYDVTHTLSKWPASGYIGDAAYIQMFHVENFLSRFNNTPKFQMLAAYFNESNRSNAMQDFTRLNIYIEEGAITRTSQVPGYTLEKLLTEFGAMLGIWLGFCIIGFMIIFRVCCLK